MQAITDVATVTAIQPDPIPENHTAKESTFVGADLAADTGALRIATKAAPVSSRLECQNPQPDPCKQPPGQRDANVVTRWEQDRFRTQFRDIRDGCRWLQPDPTEQCLQRCRPNLVSRPQQDCFPDL